MVVLTRYFIGGNVYICVCMCVCVCVCVPVCVCVSVCFLQFTVKASSAWNSWNVRKQINDVILNSKLYVMLNLCQAPLLLL